MGAKVRYYIDGHEVTKKRFEKVFPDKPLNLSGDAGITAWNKPILSNAMACHPSQIPEMMERNRKAGVHVDYNSEGQPILRSRGDRRNLMRVEQVHDKQGGYGD
jgi:hypothetical protein